jgi:hypothetical protein
MSRGLSASCDVCVPLPSNYPHQMELGFNKAFDREIE